jgi:hypothetical protein
VKLSQGENVILVSSAGVESTVIDSTGGIWVNGATPNYVEDGSTVTNLKAYGCSLLSGSTLDQKTYTLDTPIKGIRKTLAMYSTLADTLGSSMLTRVYTGSSDIYFVDNSTAIASDNHYLTFQRPYTACDLLGLSTAKWGVLSYQVASTVIGITSTATGVPGTIASSNSSGLVSS